MKLEAVEYDGSSHKKVITDTGKNIGLLYLDVDGSYYYEPNENNGVFSSYHLRMIAELLDEVNAPFEKILEEDFKQKNTYSSFILDELDSMGFLLKGKKIGARVKVTNLGHMYTTYHLMFKKLGFKNPKERKSIDGSPYTRDNISDTVFTVFNIGKHEEFGNRLYAIKDDKGNEFLFKKKGLKFL